MARPVSNLSDTIVAVGGIASVAIPISHQGVDVFNPSGDDLWLAWDANPVAEGEGSFCLPSKTGYPIPKNTGGRLRILSTAENQPFTCYAYI